MTDLLDIDLAIAAAIALGAGFMRGFTGFGSNLVMAPLFAVVFGPVPAVVMALTLDFIAGLTLLRGTLAEVRWREILPLIAFSVVAAPAGVALLVGLDADTMRRAIAVVLILSAMALLSGRRWSRRQSTLASAGVGVLSGVLTGACSMGGPPIVLYLLSGPDARAAAIRAGLIVYSIILYLAVFGALGYAGALTLDPGLRALGALPAMLLGTWVGTALFRRTGEAFWRRFALWFLVAIGGFVLVI